MADNSIRDDIYWLEQVRLTRPKPSPWRVLFDPKYLWFLSGLVLGLGAMHLKGSKDLERLAEGFKAEAFAYQTNITQMQAAIKELSHKVVEARSEVKIVEIAKPDGTKIKRTNRTSERKVERVVVTEVKEVFVDRVVEVQAEEKVVYREVQRADKKLALFAGLDRSGRGIVGGLYNAWGPLIIGGSVGLAGMSQHLAVSVGVMF